MAEFSAREQYMLELINRARMNPNAEAARYGISLNDGLSPDTISSAPKQILAPNVLLETAALAHSQHMLDVDQFAHSGIGDATPGDRITVSGYAWNTYGENIAWTSIDSVFEHHVNLFESPGHRTNILEDSFREIGVGITNGTFAYGGNDYANSLMTTQNFGAAGGAVFVTGVSYVDNVSDDDFYSVGEGAAGVAVNLFQNGSIIKSASTWASGGYALRTFASGSVEAVFSGGGVVGQKGVILNLGDHNVKVDLVDGLTIEANASITLTRGTNSARLLGIEDIFATGNDLGNTISGNSGQNRLLGGAGSDVIKGGSGVDYLHGGTGGDRLIGGVGNDRLIGGYGSDKFVYNKITDAGDTIGKFAGNDAFVFEGSAFGFGEDEGILTRASFKSGTNDFATQASHRFIYNTVNDTLWYDSNGSVAGGTRVQIADLDNDYKLAFDDIILI
jgi:serralysin